MLQLNILHILCKLIYIIIEGYGFLIIKFENSEKQK